MNFYLFLCVSLVAIHGGLAAVMTCSTTASSSPVAYYANSADISAGNQQECAAGVKYFCGGRATSTWTQGVHVLSNCASISKHTAIATFVNGKYSGHAAVFISCSSATSTINVFDQYKGMKIIAFVALKKL